MQWIEWFGYLGAALTLATFSATTMLRLRVVGLTANIAFIAFGVLGHVYPVLILHLTLLPLNAWRLRQLMQLTRQIDTASKGRFSWDWIKPFSRQRSVNSGELVFRLGDPAGELLFVLKGQFRAVEADVQLKPGEVIGELGLVTQGRTRTQTVICEQDGTLLVLTYAEVRQMYFQNPEFGFFFLELVAERLMKDAERLSNKVNSTPGPQTGSKTGI